MRGSGGTSTGSGPSKSWAEPPPSGSSNARAHSALGTAPRTPSAQKFGSIRPTRPRHHSASPSPLPRPLSSRTSSTPTMGKPGKRRSSPGPLETPAAKAAAVGAGDAPSRPAADAGADEGMGEFEDGGVEDDDGESDGDEVVSEAESSDFDGDEDRTSPFSRFGAALRASSEGSSPSSSSQPAAHDLSAAPDRLTPSMPASPPPLPCRPHRHARRPGARGRGRGRA